MRTSSKHTKNILKQLPLLFLMVLIAEAAFAQNTLIEVPTSFTKNKPETYNCEVRHKVYCNGCEMEGNTLVFQKEEGGEFSFFIESVDCDNKTNNFKNNIKLYTNNGGSKKCLKGYASSFEFVDTLSKKDFRWNKNENKFEKLSIIFVTKKADDVLADKGEISISFDVFPKNSNSTNYVKCAYTINIPFRFEEKDIVVTPPVIRPLVENKDSLNHQNALSGGIAGLCTYLGTKPPSKYELKAQGALVQLEQGEWDETNKNDRVSLEAFISKFNNCPEYKVKYFDDAQSKITELIEKKDEAAKNRAEAIQKETVAWNIIKDSENIEDFENYLAKYENSIYTPHWKEVAAKIYLLSPVRQYRKQDKDGWISIEILNLDPIYFTDISKDKGLLIDDSKLANKELRVKYEAGGDFAIQITDGNTKSESISLNNLIFMDVLQNDSLLKVKLKQGIPPYKLEFKDCNTGDFVWRQSVAQSDSILEIKIRALLDSILAKNTSIEFREREKLKLCLYVRDSASMNPNIKAITPVGNGQEAEINLDLPPLPTDWTNAIIGVAGLFVVSFIVLIWLLMKRRKKDKDKREFFEE